MHGKRWATIIVSIVISFIMILPVANFTAGDSKESSNPEPQGTPAEAVVTGIPPGWTEDILISNGSTFPDFYPSIAVDQDNVHIVWFCFWGTIPLPGQSDIAYVNSSDGGQTWSKRQILSPGDPIDVMDPDIAVNGSNIHVVWKDTRGIGPYEIIYSNSTDGGITWSDSKMITIDDGSKSEVPKISVDGSTIHVLTRDNRLFTSPNWNREIYYLRSIDGGITWDDGLGNIGQERRLTNAILASEPNGIVTNSSNVHIVFTDEREGVGSANVYYKRSVDNGATWDDGLGNIDQDRRLTNGTAFHGYAALGVNGSTIHIAWVDEVISLVEYYVYYRQSTDNGVTWGPAQLLSGPTPYAQVPELAVYEDNVHLVWMDNRDDGTTMEVYYKNSTDGGTNWNPDLRLTYVDGNHSYWPKIDVNIDTVHTAWWDTRIGTTEIYYKRSPDFPPDTSPPAHANETPPPDSYRDAPGTNISVHVTDPSGVNETTIQLWINGSLVTHTSTPITDGFNVSYESPGFDPGVIECRIVADDNLSNHLDYTWNFTVLATYEIQLHEGWNLISVPHVQVDTAINEVLRDIDGKWDYIQTYDAINGIWQSNATFKPDQLNDFNTLNHKIGFWINITEPNVNLTVRGHIPTSTNINLYAGWNLIGYPTMSTELVANALWGTGADRVEVFDPAESYRIREVGPTYIMRPGEGYWVHVPADTTWTVNW